jgi:hypothetical protein
VDGVKWDSLKVFERTIGPIAFNGDTLTILESGRTWKFHKVFGWRLFWEHLIAADYTYDMFWLKNQLFIFDRDFRLIYTQDTVLVMRDLFVEPSVSKFIKHSYDGEIVFYTRPFYIHTDRIYRFNGLRFDIIMNGIEKSENVFPNYPAITIHNNILYAGFNSPSRIKKLLNNTWINVTDTILNTPDANIFTPPLINKPTSIAFYKQQMIVGTEWTGVLAWTETGWISLSKGLRLEFPDFPEYKLYTAIVQLEVFHDKLFVGYGDPWYAPGSGRGKGIYFFNLN